MNNLIGLQAFDSAALKSICQELSMLSKQKHEHFIIGGDYDANVLIFALQKNGFECKWIDGRV